MSISHANTSNKQGGEYHLTQAQRDTIRDTDCSKVYDILCDRVDEEQLYDSLEPWLPKLYAWGSNTQNWRGAEWVNAATPRELTLPVKSKPIKLTNASIGAFLVKLANRETYGYNEETNKYILDNPNRIAYADMPAKCEGLGDWADVKMPDYWISHQPDGSVKPSILTDTSKHLEMPMTAISFIKSLEYNERGDGFIATVDGVATPLTWSTPDGAKIKKMVLSCDTLSGSIKNIKCIIYAEDGVYYQNGDNDLALIKLDFTYGDIKNVWFTDTSNCLIQNTDRAVYACGTSTGIIDSTPRFTGDVKKIPYSNSGAYSYLLAEDSKLYFCGVANTTYDLPESRDSFIHIKPDYRFDDIVFAFNNCLAIGRKVA